jgi:uncharacterized protein YjiS (DUF1127 family)
MSAPVANDQFGFSLGNLSYIGASYEEASPSVIKPRAYRVRAWIAHLLVTAAEWRRRRAIMQEMAMMTDRELCDIGLSRSDLSRVFDPTFAADRAHSGDYIAY